MSDVEKEIVGAEAQAMGDAEFAASLEATALPPHITAAILRLNVIEAILAGAFLRGAGLNPQVTSAVLVEVRKIRGLIGG